MSEASIEQVPSTLSPQASAPVGEITSPVSTQEEKPLVTTYTDPGFNRTQVVVEGAQPQGLLQWAENNPEKVVQAKEARMEDQKKQTAERRAKEDEQVRQVYETQGAPVAAALKMEFLKKDIQGQLGINEEQLGELLGKDASEILQKLFVEKIKEEMGYKGVPTEEIPEDIQKKIQAEALVRAHDYQEKTKGEIAGDMIEDIFNSVDFEVFLWAVLGKDVGAGKYGSRSEQNKVHQSESPATSILEAFTKFPDHRAEFLAAGFAACKDRSVIDALKNYSSPESKIAVAQALEKLSKDPSMAKMFMWGINNRLGQPVNFSPEQAMLTLAEIARKEKEKVINISKLDSQSSSDEAPAVKAA